MHVHAHTHIDKREQVKDLCLQTRPQISSMCISTIKVWFLQKFHEETKSTEINASLDHFILGKTMIYKYFTSRAFWPVKKPWKTLCLQICSSNFIQNKHRTSKTQCRGQVTLGIWYPQRQISPTLLPLMSIRRNSHPGIREKEKAKLSVTRRKRKRKIIPCLKEVKKKQLKKELKGDLSWPVL